MTDSDLDGSDIELSEDENGSLLDETGRSDGGLDEALDRATKTYRLPDWFLEHNIKTFAQLNSIQTKLLLLEPSKLEDKNKMREEGYQENDKNKQDCYQISLDLFSEIHDVTAAAFIPNERGELLKSEPSVLLRWPSGHDRRFSDAVLAHLARELGTDAISLDLTDLEDLADDFDVQERQVDSSKPEGSLLVKGQLYGEPMTGLSMYYFAARSKRNATKESYSRSKRAFGAILDGPANKEDAVRTEEAAKTPDRSNIKVKAHSRPILLHVYDAKAMLKLRNGHRFLARMRDTVRERREAGQRIVLLVSVSPAAVLDYGCPCLACGSDDSRLSRIISAKTGNTVTIPPDKDTKNDRGYPRPEFPLGYPQPGFLPGVTNIRRLKRMLRRRIAYAFAKEDLQPHAVWSQQGLTPESLSGSLWSNDNFQQIVTQVVGRFWGKSRLELDDIRVVLKRMGHYDTAKINLPTDGRGSPNDEVEAWSDEKARIKFECNQYEKALLENVINPDAIETIFEDVIIDKETKETIRHMASMSNFNPGVQFSSRRQQFRVNGVLFYGPPGTGKTHISRAVAKESGASMLAVDSAIIRSKWVGETEKYIKAIFTLAARLFPCVLFIDEVDALFYRRHSGDKSWERDSLTQFLQEMDGLSKSDRAPLVVVATNRPSDLDEAFLRRLSQKILFKLPDMDARAKILRTFLSDDDLDPSVSIEFLAARTDGYSGSDLRELCAYAAMIWAMERSREQQQSKAKDETEASNQVPLSSLHFDKALARIRPSVSQKALRDIEEFAQRFNIGNIPAEEEVTHSKEAESHISSPKKVVPAVGADYTSANGSVNANYASRHEDPDALEACNASMYDDSISHGVLRRCERCSERSYIHQLEDSNPDPVAKDNLPRLCNRCHHLLQDYVCWSQGYPSDDKRGDQSGDQSDNKDSAAPPQLVQFIDLSGSNFSAKCEMCQALKLEGKPYRKPVMNSDRVQIEYTPLAINLLGTPYSITYAFISQHIHTPRVLWREVRSWLAICDTHCEHLIGELQTQNLVTLDPWMIDVDERRLVRMSEAKDIIYAALSYVWGGPQPMLLKENIARMREVGVLDQPNVCSQVIRDAILICRRTGVRYLWVDALCILQDATPEELSKQVDHMDSIYANAYFTIVAADSTNAHEGIHGVSIKRPQPRPFGFYVEKEGSIDIQQATLGVSSVEVLANSTRWATRAWTYQEALLSRRLLVFTEELCFLVCPNGVYGRDDKIPDGIFKKMEQTGDRNHLKFLSRDSPHFKSPTALYELITAFSTRNLTIPSDILKAFTGIMTAMKEHSEMRYGMPLSDLNFALSWKHHGLDPNSSISTRMLLGGHLVGHPSGQRQGFPTWSWAGWLHNGAKVHFPGRKLTAKAAIHYLSDSGTLETARGCFQPVKPSEGIPAEVFKSLSFPLTGEEKRHTYHTLAGFGLPLDRFLVLKTLVLRVCIDCTLTEVSVDFKASIEGSMNPKALTEVSLDWKTLTRLPVDWKPPKPELEEEKQLAYHKANLLDRITTEGSADWGIYVHNFEKGKQPAHPRASPLDSPYRSIIHVSQEWMNSRGADLEFAVLGADTANPKILHLETIVLDRRGDLCHRAGATDLRFKVAEGSSTKDTLDRIIKENTVEVVILG